MVRITAGSFPMGTDDGDPDEKPVHRVTLPAFDLDRTEVTVGAYAACVAAGSCIPYTTVESTTYSEGQKKAWSQYCNWGKARREQHPINCVPWDEAKKFCVWANKRLPTEEEWEYAARGAEGRTYPWGEDFPGPTLLNACGGECSDKFPGWDRMYSGNDGWWHTAPVGSFPAGTSPFGVLDLAGNVWEWTDSEYSRRYDQPRNTGLRVARGGSWSVSQAAVARGAFRLRLAPGDRNYFLGFRCARTALLAADAQ
jgi:formylglycine-generating enzyme required for sulfatase activity